MSEERAESGGLLQKNEILEAKTGDSFNASDSRQSSIAQLFLFTVKVHYPNLPGSKKHAILIEVIRRHMNKLFIKFNHFLFEFNPAEDINQPPCTYSLSVSKF